MNKKRAFAGDELIKTAPQKIFAFEYTCIAIHVTLFSFSLKNQKKQRTMSLGQIYWFL